jgi:DNA-binding GntR family transcriptional regulator
MNSNVAANPAGTNTVRRESLRDEIRERLLQRIGSGELGAGTWLNEAQLAREMGVSAIPVREAIRELVALGILQSQTHRGTWVREVSLAETIEALEVRVALDGLAAQTAAARLRNGCAALRQTVKDLVASARQRDFVRFQEVNQRFHRAIIEASGNRVLLRVWDSLAFGVRTKFVMDFLSSVDPVAIAREHDRIVAALDRGDAKAAARALEDHSERLVRYLRAQAKQAEKQNPDQGTP